MPWQLLLQAPLLECPVLWPRAVTMRDGPPPPSGGGMGRGGAA